MNAKPVDAGTQVHIPELGQRVLGGEDITPEEGRWLFDLESREDIFDLLGWANRIRERFKGNRIHLCSIVNIKAGGCSEDCRFCAQSASYETNSPRHGLIEQEVVLNAAKEAKANGVVALGLVAAWRGLDEGPALDQICRRMEELKARGSPTGSGSQVWNVTTITWRPRDGSFLRSAQRIPTRSGSRQSSTSRKQGSRSVRAAFWAWGRLAQTAASWLLR
jgi:hypothetical protein